jgi:hypothetical protein
VATIFDRFQVDVAALVQTEIKKDIGTWHRSTRSGHHGSTKHVTWFPDSQGSSLPLVSLYSPPSPIVIRLLWLLEFIRYLTKSGCQQISQWLITRSV